MELLQLMKVIGSISPDNMRELLLFTHLLGNKNRSDARVPEAARLHDDLSIIALFAYYDATHQYSCYCHVRLYEYSYLSSGNSTEAVMYPIRISLEARESPELQQPQQQRSSGGWGPWR